MNERGVALAISVFALVVIGALVAGAFFMGMQEYRVGRNTIQLQQAFGAAEEGANRQVANWDSGVNNLLAVGDSVTFSGSVVDARSWYRGSVRRLNDQLFFVRAEGFSVDSTTRMQVGLLVRLRPIDVPIKAALQTQGDLRIGGSISGHDNPPSGWSCPPAEPSKPGILINDDGSITTSDCENLVCVDGSVKVQEDPAITADSLTTFGDASFDDLEQYATIIIPGGNRTIQPSVSGGVCNKADRNNWGDPLNPAGVCGDYFPVIWSEGDLTVSQHRGQGILIVNGDLDVHGGFEFYGPVIVRGALDMQRTGGHVTGGVIAANVGLEQSEVLGNAVVSYSSCAVTKALRASAAGSLLTERSWANLY